MKNDVLILDNADHHRFEINMMMKKIINRFTMIRIHQFLMGVYDNYLKYGFDLSKLIMLNFTINDIITNSLHAAPLLNKMLGLQKVTISFGKEKTIRNIEIDKKIDLKKFFGTFTRNNNGRIIDHDYIRSMISIPITLNLYTEKHGIIKLQMVFLIFTKIVMTISWKDFGSPQQQSFDGIDVQSNRQEYQTEYTCQCNFRTRSAQISTDLFNIFGGEALYKAFYNVLLSCLTNELANFIYQEIYVGLMDASNYHSFNTIVKLRNNVFDSQSSSYLQSEQFTIENQRLKHRNIVNLKIDPINVNLLECVLSKLFEGYCNVNRAIMRNDLNNIGSQRLNEIDIVDDDKENRWCQRVVQAPNCFSTIPLHLYEPSSVTMMQPPQPSPFPTISPINPVHTIKTNKPVFRNDPITSIDDLNEKFDDLINQCNGFRNQTNKLNNDIN